MDKARQAGTAGADALIVALNAAGARADPDRLACVAAPPKSRSPASRRRTGTRSGPQSPAGTTTGTVRKHPNHPGIRDGDFENGIIIHEYGHGVSNRLTGGPGINCLSGNEQAGEGWSDYYAISMLLDPTIDDPNQPRGMGPYALFQADRHGAGIRPRPYTRDMSIQPFTYDSIKTGGWLNGSSLALPHGLGHGWAAVLWDMNWDLIDKHGFNPHIYGAWNTGGNNRANQYVMDGLKMQGCGPGLVVARGAIIAAADLLSEGEDTCTSWASFARRGLGYSAVQGTTNRDDNSEAFDTHPDCQEGFVGGINDEPSLNVVNAGTTRPMEFTLGGNQGLDILASDSPYSRQVDCNTLQTVDPAAQFITPRPIPVKARDRRADARLHYDPSRTRTRSRGRRSRSGTARCREFVLTRKDGVQHRAYFRFGKEPRSPSPARPRRQRPAGRRRDGLARRGRRARSRPRPTRPGSTSSTASSAASPTRRPRRLSGCELQTKQVLVKQKTTLDFTLGPATDAFGYVCSVGQGAFQEAATALTLTGDDASATLTLPFTFRYYGTDYTTAWVSTNGVLNFQGRDARRRATWPSPRRPTRTLRSTRSGTTCSWTPRQACERRCWAPRPTGGSWSSGGTSTSSATRRGASTSTSCCTRTDGSSARPATSPTTGVSAATRRRSGSRTPTGRSESGSGSTSRCSTRDGGQHDPVPAARLGQRRACKFHEGPARAGPLAQLSSQTTKRLSTRSGTSGRSQPPTSTSVRTRLPSR